MIVFCAAFFVFMGALSSWAQTTAPLICQTGPGDCDLFKESCTSVLDETLRDFSDWTTTKISQYYAGKNIVFDMSPQGGTNYPTSGPVCNAAKGELLTNALGQDCGKTLLMTENGGMFIGDRGRRENSYKLGMYTAGFKCFSEKIKQEISQGGVIVSPKCKQIADDIAGLVTQGGMIRQALLDQAQVSALTSNFCSQKIILDFRNSNVPDFCRNLANESDSNAVKLTTLMQAACLLSSSRSALKAAYKNLLQCEHSERLTASYSAAVGGPNSLFIREFGPEIDAVINSEADRAKRACMRRFRLSVDCAVSRTVAGVQNWYDRRIGPKAAEFTNAKYPETGACYSP